MYAYELKLYIILFNQHHNQGKTFADLYSYIILVVSFYPFEICTTKCIGSNQDKLL